ncbi:glycosyltransferase [Thermoanaerobacterium sp. DL9XJH110]|uniref:glycosyltransferase n=1 Tax=Thermoanaerobacterium sp. DL9XJH110 TaxID=3386643 RepID=UPI003BB77A67
MERIISTADISLAFLTLLAVFGIIYIFQIIASGFSESRPGRHPDVIIVVKNAQDHIEDIVRNFYRHVSGMNSRELIIVDNGSLDQTRGILEKLSLQFPGLKVILLSDSHFRGCIMEALNLISEPVVVIIDATRMSYKEVKKLTNFYSSKKGVEIGLNSH